MKKIKINDVDLKTQWQANAKERLYHFTISNGQIRGAVVYASQMIAEMQKNHNLGVLESLILGHTYLAATLMTTNIKGADRLSIQIDCSGPVKGLVVEANAFGEVRGYLKNVPIPVTQEMEDFNTSPFFGAGFLSVTKSLESAKSPFTGQVILKHGSIAKDISYYYLKSEQIPTAFHLSVQFNKEGRVVGAGGLFLQVLPGADENDVISMETKVAEMSSLGTVFSQGKKADDFALEYFSKTDIQILGNRKVAFMCHCGKEKIGRLLTMFSPEEFDDIKKNGPFPLEVACHYCGTRYEFSAKEIDILAKKKKNRN